MTDRFSAADLSLLRDRQEVDIETRAGPDSPAHRTTIWIVVDDQDRALIRTYLGPDSRWYREVRAGPDCLLHVAGRVLPVRAVAADDPDRVAAYSAAMQDKYATSRSMRAMLADALLPTTLELLPR
jgi:hypothetical protein